MARMTSSRLAGKPMLEVAGHSLLEYHVKRLQQAKNIDEIYIATTTNQSDDIIAKFCDANNIKCFRGSEDDVLSRYYHCANEAEADIIVRVTGDCPLIDPSLVDRVIAEFKVNANWDYAHLDIHKFPRGFDCEVFARSTLNQAHAEANLPSEREHVTSFIYSHPERYGIFPVSTDIAAADLRFCVDEIDDFKLIEKIAEHFGERMFTATWQEIIDIVRLNPSWKTINQQVEQKLPQFNR